MRGVENLFFPGQDSVWRLTTAFHVAQDGNAPARGWGIRFGLKGVVTFSVPSLRKDYLQIKYRYGARLRTVRVMSSEPARLVSAIEAARARTRAPVEGRTNGAEQRAHEAVQPSEEDTAAAARP